MSNLEYLGAPTYKLLPGSIECDSEAGPQVRGMQLLNREGIGKRWAPKPKADIEALLRRAYDCDIDATNNLGALRAIANALNSGEIARAQMATLLMRLPDPPASKAAGGPREELRKFLVQSGFVLKDWNPDEHPRTGAPPNPGGFAPKEDG